MTPDSIILDIDGTLWNSTPIVSDAWNQSLELRSSLTFRFTTERLTHLFGYPMQEIADLSFPSLPPQERYALLDDCMEREHAFLSACTQDLLYPGVADTVRKLSSYCPLFIVSNCQSGYIELFLEKTGLASCITDFECPGNTGLGKGPNIRLVMERNGLKAPVYVGDIESDRQAAAEAGIPFCHASYGFGSVEAPDYAVSSFPDLLTLFPRQI